MHKPKNDEARDENPRPELGSKASSARPVRDPERLLWSWVEDCVKPNGWIRYSPDVARALGSDRAALVLSYAIHLDGRGTGQYSAGRWFYLSIREWSQRLYLPVKAVERALQLLAMDFPRPREIQYSLLPDAKGKVRKKAAAPEPLGLLHRWLANKYNSSATPVYYYRIDWTRLLEWWAKQSQNYGQLPLALDCRNCVSALPTGHRLGQKGLIDESEKAQLISPSTLNQYGLYGQTSEDIPTEEGTPKESEPVSAAAAERPRQSDFLAGSYGLWLQGDSAKAIRRMFISEGWHEKIVDDALYKAFERGHCYVDLVDYRARLKDQYDANPELDQWPGYFADQYLRGY
jgi:hypothetical protein